jgi:hypothetical protein
VDCAKYEFGKMLKETVDPWAMYMDTRCDDDLCSGSSAAQQEVEPSKQTKPEPEPAKTPAIDMDKLNADIDSKISKKCKYILNLDCSL